MARKLTYSVGDRVRCFAPAPKGTTGTVVKVNPATSSPYKVSWDHEDPFHPGQHNESWVSPVNVFGKES